MAFPITPLPIKVEIDLGSDQTWTDITSDVRSAEQIQITRGRSDWGQQVDAGQCRFTLDNRTGNYSPRNPEGAYYGQIGRNTPVRVSVNAGEVALDLPGTSGSYIATPDAAALDITGDIDIRIDATLPNWAQSEYPSSGNLNYPRTQLLGKYSAGQVSWGLFTVKGRPYFMWSADGTSTTYVWSDGDLPVSPSGRLALRFTMDVNNGAGGKFVAFYTAPTMDGPWVDAGSGTLSGTTSIFSGTAPLQIGDLANADDEWTPALGQVHKVEIRSGINGTIVADPDFTAQTAGATSFADTAGRTWTVAGNAEITDRKTRFVGEVASWNTRWDTGGFDVVTEVEAAGVLRRLGLGQVPTKSPFYREFTNAGRKAAGVVAYWPMEDGDQATQFASAYDDHPPFTITGTVTPAVYADWAASAPLPTVGTGSMKVTVPTYTLNSVDYSTVGFFVKIPPAGVISTQRLMSVTTAGIAQTWSIKVNTAGQLSLVVNDYDGVELVSTTFTANTIIGRDSYIILDMSWSIPTTTYSVTVVDIADSLATSIPDNVSDVWSFSGTLTGPTDQITRIRFGEDGAMNGTVIGHVVVGNMASTFRASAGTLVGWNAEEAPSRVARIGSEEQIFSFPTSAGDEQTGPQPSGTALDIMRSAEEVDGGILAELRTALGLRFITRVSMYNQTPALVLDYEGSDGLVAPLDPVEDDQSITNDVLVQRTDGASARAILSTGPLSTEPPPVGIGLYDTSVTLNLLDDTQPHYHAGWRLHLGTVDETRFPQVTVDLAAAPESISSAVGIDTGSRIQIANPAPWMPPGNIDLLTQGYSEVIDQYTWKITYNCSPYTPWNVGHLHGGKETTFVRADTEGTELIAAETTTSTEFGVQTTSGPGWVTAAPNLLANYDFETNLTGWTGSGSTITREATPGTPPFPGLWSLKMVPNGVAEFPNAGSDQVAVTAGQSYTLSGYLYCETARSVDLNINWFSAGSTYLSTTANSQAVAANTWTWFQVSGTAPATAVTANASPTVASFPPSTDVLWGDMITLRRTIAGELPQDFPFDLRVGGEVVRATACTNSVYDTFGRTTANSWGTADLGGTWTDSGGVASDYAVSGGYGSHTLTTVNSTRRSTLASPYADFDLYCDITTSAAATGASLTGSIMARAVDGNNLYCARLEFTTANAIILVIRKRVASTESTIGSAVTLGFTHTPGTSVRVRFQGSGTTLRAKAWLPTTSEPGPWQVETTDGDLTTAASLGCRSSSNSGNTNTNPQIRYDNFTLANPQTFTVTRSVNGITKTHTAGTDVRLAYPAITAL